MPFLVALGFTRLDVSHSNLCCTDIIYGVSVYGIPPAECCQNKQLDVIRHHLDMTLTLARGRNLSQSEHAHEPQWHSHAGQEELGRHTTTVLGEPGEEAVEVWDCEWKTAPSRLSGDLCARVCVCWMVRNPHWLWKSAHETPQQGGKRTE